MSFRLTTKGQYGIRALSLLAEHYGKGYLSIKTIADTEEIPVRYLEQIMGQLRRKEIVQSIRGPSGGYKLNHPPDLITLDFVLHALEGEVSFVRCTGKNQADCPREGTCTVHDFWQNLNRILQSLFKRISLHDMINSNCEMENVSKTVALLADDMLKNSLPKVGKGQQGGIRDFNANRISGSEHSNHPKQL